MFKIRFHLYDWFALGIITCFILLIYFTNFSGNFWLTGWDNLHPEFNFQANIDRALFSSWQEYQGVGLPAGHGHATELSREVLLYFLNFFFPGILIRKIFTILMLWTGVVGLYVLLRNIFLSRVTFDLRIVVSLIGALFYLLNLATLQIFYVPYEAFLAMYGLLPWMIYSLYTFMLERTKRSFFFFLLINFLGTWQFYIPTLFIVYMIFVGIVVLGIVFELKIKWRYFFIALSSIIVVNLYWLLPFTYYILNNIHSQQDAYLNILYTEDTYLKNAAFGALEHASILRGFLFDNVQFAAANGFQYMMGPWITHMNMWYVLFIGYSFFIVILIGLFYSLVKRSYLHLCGAFVLFFALIANQTFPFTLFNEALRSIPLLDQVFRNPFTKIANVTLLLMTIFLSIGLVLLITKIEKHWRSFFAQKYLYLFVLYLFLIVINIYMFPIWQGSFIYPELKKSIPQEYFQVFDYFNKQGDGRVANLPQFTPNGWEYYQWGYQGSGFLWYGIKQPILDRAFDVWNKDNENYYWEISEAIYSENTQLVEAILGKYQIKWLLLDENVSTTSSSSILFTDVLKGMVKDSQKITLVKQFGKISIYEVNLQAHPRDYISLTEQLPNILPTYQWNNRDQGYIDYGNYKSTDEVSDDEATIYYPFRSLFTGRRQEDNSFSVSENSNSFIFRQEIPDAFENGELIIPEISQDEITEIDSGDIDKTAIKTPAASKSENYIEVIIPKINGYFSDTAVVSNSIKDIEPNNCNQYNRGFFSMVPSESDAGILLNLYSKHSNNCLDFQLPSLSQRFAYILSVQSKYEKGKSLYLTVNNNTTKREELATYLPKKSTLNTSYYFLPRRQTYGIGYSIHLDNISLDQTDTSNQLGEIRINPIPYEFLAGIKLVEHSEKYASNEAIFAVNVTHNKPYSYTVLTDLSEYSKYLILSQSYNSGWKAYVVDGWWSKTFPTVFGKELKDHEMVNNWANGWKLEGKPQQIVIIFWPQYLEYFGFVLLPLPFIYALWPRRKKKEE